MGIFKWLKKATKVIGKMAVEAAEEDERSKYSPNPEWMGQMDLVNSRANARILAPQLLKQAQDCARILTKILKQNCGSTALQRCMALPVQKWRLCPLWFLIMEKSSFQWSICTNCSKLSLKKKTKVNPRSMFILRE